MKMRRLLSVLLALAMLMSVISVGIVATSAADVDTADAAADVDAAGSAYEDMLAATSADNNYGLSSTVNDGTILQAWTWSFANIDAKLEQIAEQGFTTVQVSPPNEIKKGTKNAKFLQSDNANGWWMFYQPAGFQLNQSTDNALGTKAEFEAMCTHAHELGVKIIVDAVINHMGTKDGDDNNTSTDPMSHVTPRAQTFEPEIYNNSLFHSPWKQMQYIESNNTYYNSAYDLTRNCTSGLPDLKTEDTRVQNAIYDYMAELVEAGADGFRFDAAKHIETPDDHDGLGSAFWTNTLGKVRSQYPDKENYAYGEILNTCGIDRPFSWYTKLMDVTDSSAYWGIKDAVTSGGSGGTPYYPSTNFTSANTMLWDESHDTYVDGSTTSLNTIQRGKIWALVAGRAGISCVYLARPSDDTNTNALYNITLGTANNTSWSNATTKAINQFHNFYIGKSEYCTANQSGTAYIERDTTGAVIVNLGGTTSKSVNLTNHKLANGTYKDTITGGTFTVSGGKISGQVGSTGVATIYKDDVLTPPTEAPTEPPITFTLGDVDDNGDVETIDVTLIMRATIGKYAIESGSKAFYAADIDGDGYVTVIDATLIQRHLASLSVKYPIGEEQVVQPVQPTSPYVIPTTPVYPTSSYPTQGGGGDTVTLYFSNNKFWDSVNVYMWSNAGGESTAWPGVAATYVGDNDYGEGIYSVTIDTSVYDMVIFNGSGGQTDDIDVAYAASQGCGLYCLDTQGVNGYEVGYYEYAPVNPVNPTTTPVTPTQGGGGETVTLYFSNNKNWDSVNVYMWSNAGGESTAWPGVAATYVGNNDYGEGIYSVTIDTSVYDMVIFNGSGGQTDDIDVAYAASQGCGLYCLDTQGVNGYEVGYYEYAPVNPVNPTTTPVTPTQGGGTGETVTLYFSNNKNWDSVNVYMWNNAGGESTAWPGVAATYVGNNDYGEGIYSVTIDTSVYDMVIFNGSGGQTDDIDVAYAASQGCGLYCLDTQGVNGYEVGYYEYAPVNPVNPTTTPVTPTQGGGTGDSGYYLVGSFNSWTPSAAYLMTENSANPGEYQISATLAEGDGVKVVGISGDVQTWYPDGMGDEYIVDAAHAGAVTIYFKSTYQAEWSAFGGYMYIDAGATPVTPTTAPVTPTQGGGTGETVTLYFSNNKNWDSVNVYMWSNAGGESTAWPGVAATYVGNNDYGEGIYSVTIDTSVYDMVIFNGSGGQTDDVDVAYAASQGCGLYCLDTQGVSGYEVGYYEYAPVNPVNPTTTPVTPTQGGGTGETVTLYFSNNKNWSSVNVYMWSNAGGESTAWPGVAATYVGNNDYGEGIYSVTIDTSVYDMVIFNGSGGQTADVDVAYAASQGCGLYCLDTTNSQGHFEVGYYAYS